MKVKNLYKIIDSYYRYSYKTLRCIDFDFVIYKGTVNTIDTVIYVFNSEGVKAKSACSVCFKNTQHENKESIPI
jgi:hypothetical protein